MPYNDSGSNESVGTECTGCGKTYSYIGVHWAKSACGYPEISEYKDVLTGLLIGDGCATRPTKNTYIEVTSVTRPFLDHLDTLFGEMSRGVSLKVTAEDTAQGWAEWSGEPWSAEGCRDIWRFETRTHPDMNEYREWYSSSEIIYPPGLNLTPTIAKYWYASDGGLGWAERSVVPQLDFYTTKEEQCDYMAQWFEDSGFTPRINPGKSIYFPTAETEEILQWMGDPVPGFEYKWSADNLSAYRRSKEQCYERSQ